jgi:hypothetical protein
MKITFYKIRLHLQGRQYVLPKSGIYYKSTRRYNPEDYHRHHHCGEKLKFHTVTASNTNVTKEGQWVVLWALKC